MAEKHSTASPATPDAPYCGHVLEGAEDYHDAAMLELAGAKGLLAAIAQASEVRAVPDAAPALWALVEKLEAAQHYAKAAWELGARIRPTLVATR